MATPTTTSPLTRTEAEARAARVRADAAEARLRAREADLHRQAAELARLARLLLEAESRAVRPMAWLRAAARAARDRLRRLASDVERHGGTAARTTVTALAAGGAVLVAGGVL